jgi:long-chain-fatty-acid--CoA ligase ACSBG
MISHDNITYVVRHLGDLVKLKPFHERIISYLPLSHIAAQALDLFCPLAFGITIYFAQPDALKGSLNKTMVEVKPTFFFGVPRVFEKIQENIEKVTNNLTGFKLKLYLWSRRVASEHVLTNFDGLNKTSASFQLARKLIVDANFKKLGLDQCRYFYSGYSVFSLF